VPANPLDYVDFDDILQHGDPDDWTYVGPKPGSPVAAHSPNAAPGTLKHYDIYKDSFGDELEVHYFRHPDGSVGDLKVRPRR
jgi:hypothetical protein